MNGEEKTHIEYQESEHSKSEEPTRSKSFRECKAIMEQSEPFETVWTNRPPTPASPRYDELDKMNTGQQQGKSATGQEWTAEKLYEAVCLKGYYNLAQELNASIAAERKAFDKIAENARQLHIYNQQLRSQLILQQKLGRLLAVAPSS